MPKEKKKELVEQIKDRANQKTTKKDIRFYKTGCTMFDLCLGGGLGKGYISNIVGDNSTGKTLLSTEAIGFNNHKYKKRFDHYYDDAEGGFTLDTKTIYNYNTNLVEPESITVETFGYNIDKHLKKKKVKDGMNCIYVLDSLDSLSSNQETKKFDEKIKQAKKALDGEKEEKTAGTYGMERAKGMSEFFRVKTNKINKTKMHLIIISQVRDNIGVSFGRKHKRNGGKALDFFASAVVWLAKVKTIYKTIKVGDQSYTRAVGIIVKIKIDKNKLGKPFRECYINIDFNMGVDNVKTNIYFLYSVFTPKGEMRENVEFDWDGKKYKQIDSFIKFIEENNFEDELEKRTIERWNLIEDSLVVDRKRKY